MVRKIKKEELYEEIDKMFMLISLSSRRFFEILMGKVYGSYEE